MTIHIFGMQFSSFVRAVQLCCEEKNIPYTVGLEHQDKTIAFKSAEHVALNPFGKIPVLITADITLFEAQTILRYLDSAYPTPALQPENIHQRFLVDQWCSAISTTIDQCLVRKYLLEFVFPTGENGSVRWEKVEQATPAVLTMLNVLNKQLGNQEYLVNNQFSLADILLLPMVDYLLGSPKGEALFAEVPALKNYVLALRQRPAARKVFG